MDAGASGRLTLFNRAVHQALTGIDLLGDISVPQLYFIFGTQKPLGRD